MVSIIVTFLNAEKHLKNCIENLLAQTSKDYEIILIDDNSTDASAEIVKQYKTEKIKYYKMEKETIGVGAARNFGIKKSTGKYIMFVDVDDYIDEKLIENLQIYMNKAMDLVKYKLQFVDKNRKIIEKIDGPCFENMKGYEGFNELCFKDILLDSPCLYLMKKSFLEKYHLEFTENVYHEDFGLMPLMIITAEKMASTNLFAYYYVQSDQSIMRDKNREKTIKKANDKIVLYDNLVEKIETININQETLQNLMIYYTNSIILTVETLEKKNRKAFIKEIKSRKMYKNIKIRNFKQLIKRIILRFNVGLYLKVR